MVLSFLVFMPIVTVPTLFFLKKDFQIKMLACATGLIHLFLTVGLISKSGYRFRGFQLKEAKPLMENLGFDYSLALSATALQFLVAAAALFLVVFAFSFQKIKKREVVSMLIIQSCCFGAILTSDLLLHSIFLEIVILALVFIGKFSKDKIFKTLVLSFIGLFFMMLATTTFSILYESINLKASLNFLKLNEIRTPFIKNSLFSTQTILFFSFTLGFLFKIFSVFYIIKASDSSICLKKIGQLILFFGVLLFSYNRLTDQLFPEVKTVYLSKGLYEWPFYIGSLFLLCLFYGFKFFQMKRMES